MIIAANSPQTDEAAALRRVVLASASPSRQMILAAAGVEFSTSPADLDEHEIKRSLMSEQATPQEVALTLAAMKAVRISDNDREALVIGADQVLTADGRLFDKPVDRAAARATLRQLRGRDHALHAGLAVACDGVVIWRHLETATLTMRAFSDDFLEAYLDSAGDAILSSVGAYRLEGLGVQLFSDINGDYFTILGLPMVSLSTCLRDLGALMS